MHRTIPRDAMRNSIETLAPLRTAPGGDRPSLERPASTSSSRPASVGFRARKLRDTFGALALLVLSQACASGPPLRNGPIVQGDYRYLDRYMDWMIEAGMDRTKTPGVSVAVVDDQRIVWSKAYGYADRERRIPATTKTLYRAGSMSKLLTATEVMRRAQGGCIALDRALSEQLPAFAIRSRFTNAANITPRSLLAHHSGLPSDYLNGMWTEHPVDLATLVGYLKNDSLIAPPQTEYNYSNLDYSVLGRLIELCSGEPYAKAMSRELLQPLGMVQSSFDFRKSTTSVLAPGYHKGQAALPIELRDGPAGALVSSVEDLARFVEFVLADGRTRSGQQLLPVGALREMWKPQFSGMPLDFGHDIGLGWMIEGMAVNAAVGSVAWHNGGYPAYFGHLAVAPARKLGVVFLANGDDAHDFANATGTRALELALEAKLGLAVPAVEPPKKKARVELSEAKLAEYAGDYVVFSQLSRIEKGHDHLTVDMMGTKLELLPVASDTFMPQVSALLGIINVPLPALSLRFDAVGPRRFFVLGGLPEPFPFERFTATPLPAAWAPRLGSYRMEVGDPHLRIEQMQLEMRAGALVAHVVLTSDVWGVKKMSATAGLRPISDTEAVVVGAGHGEGGVLRVLDGAGPTRLFYSGFVLAKSDSREPTTN
jgi:CubicO group peptidase (beta-lactamase class C family)